MWANWTITKSGSPRSVKAPHLDARWDIPPGTPLAAVLCLKFKPAISLRGQRWSLGRGAPSLGHPSF